MAIRTRRDISDAAKIHLLPHEKIQEYDYFPLAHRLGLIHSIPEEEFQMASATITDVSFPGLFPKGLKQIFNTYSHEIRRTSPEDENKIKTLIDKVITAFIYRPITLQKVIQVMLSKKKRDLEQEDLTQENDTPSTDPSQPTSHNNDETISRSVPTSSLSRVNTSNTTGSSYTKPCYAIRCRLL
jgi:hypothetical protein